MLRLCGSCGPLVVVVALTGWLMAGVLPLPPGPDDSPLDLAARYGAGVRVPLGLALSSIGVCFVMPLIAAIAYLMWRSRPNGTLLMLIQLISGTVTSICLLLPLLIMAVAGFRPDRNPEITVLLNDIAWLLFITPIAPFIIQNVVIGVSVLSSTRSPFPRWIGFLNFWVGLSFSFDILAFVYRSGPLAWDGLLIFWLALTTYSIWLLAMGLSIRQIARDVRRSADG